MEAEDFSCKMLVLASLELEIADWGAVLFIFSKCKRSRLPVEIFVTVVAGYWAT